MEHSMVDNIAWLLDIVETAPSIFAIRRDCNCHPSVQRPTRAGIKAQRILSYEKKKEKKMVIDGGGSSAKVFF